MSKLPLFFVIIVAIIVIAGALRFVQQRREARDNDAAPLLQKQVVVSNKQEKVLNDRRSRQQMTAPAGSSMRYDAGFTPRAGGLEMRFRLTETQYHALTVGEKGTLSYKGTRFIAFVAE